MAQEWRVSGRSLNGEIDIGIYSDSWSGEKKNLPAAEEMGKNKISAKFCDKLEPWTLWGRWGGAEAISKVPDQVKA